MDGCYTIGRVRRERILICPGLRQSPDEQPDRQLRLMALQGRSRWFSERHDRVRLWPTRLDRFEPASTPIASIARSIQHRSVSRHEWSWSRRAIGLSGRKPLKNGLSRLQRQEEDWVRTSCTGM